MAQVDREFWFAIPKETSGHGSITAANNVSFKIAAMSLPAVVTISMPANAAFPVQTYNVPAGTSTVAVLATSFAQFANIYNNNAASGSEAVTGKTNRGILIQSDNDITVYYDYDDDYNRDLFSLKGKNSLGTDFYCPFQKIWTNGTGYTPKPLTSIEIVATENNTTITIDPTSNNVYPTVKFKGRPNLNPFTITLNKGEAYSVVDSIQAPTGHAAGTRITSDKNISVTINDDSGKGANNSCYDIMGDQLVPTNILGVKYLVMTGNASLSHATAGITPHDDLRGDQIVVTATQPNTTITFRGRDGTLLYTAALTLKGQTDYFSPDITKTNQTSIYVSCVDPSKPFYVQHITGIGCELGGAIVPPITNCTGSSEVTFYPALIAGNQTEVTVNLMIPYDKNYAFTDSVHQSYYYFTLYNSTYPGGYHIPGSWFELSDSAGWAVLKVANRNFGQTGISTGKNLVVWGANKITNSMDFFHLGMTDGRQSYTNKYGYFSSFNAQQAQVRVASTETQDYVGCYGRKITLAAKGGLDYTWHYGSPTGPPTYLNDPKSANPDVIGAPSGSHNFYVEVKQAKCFGTAVLKVNVVVLPQTTARLGLDKTTICAIDTVRFTNQSIQASIFSWKKKIDNYPETDFYPSSDIKFYEVLDNPSNTTPRVIRYTLYAEHIQGCNDTVSRTVTIYPKIHAGFTASDSIVCNDDPRQPIKFTDKSGGNLGIYTWDFGDQGSATIPGPQHLFKNIGMKDTTYKVRLVVKSPFYCTDTARKNILVHPYIKASFTVDTTRKCSPYNITIFNNSQGPITSFLWDFGDGTTSLTTNVPTLTHLYTNITNVIQVRKLKLTVQNSGGCIDTLSRYITVYPQVAAVFSVPASAGCNSFGVNFTNNTNAAATSFVWDFGDGSTSNLRDPSHLFVNNGSTDQVFKVKLTAYSPDYCTGYDSTDITVYANLDPQFSIDVPKTCAPYNATITNKSLGGIANYTWDLGDGNWSTSNAPSFKHLYRNTLTTTVTRTVKLIVQNAGGCKDSVNQTITLYPEVNAQFGTSLGNFCSPRRVDFINQSNSVATKFIWKFGDNGTSLAKDTIHYYENRSNRDTIFNAYLVAISNDECKDSTGIFQVLVYPYIEAYFALDTASGCNPLNVKISNGSLGPYTAETWDFNNGLPASGAQPKIFSHVFINSNVNSNKNFIVSLRLTYKGTCLKTFFKPVLVYAPVIPKVSANITTVCNNSEIAFKDSSNRPPIPYNYKWDFGDGGSMVGIYGANRSLPVVTKHQFENFLTVYKPVKVNFATYSQYGCQGDTSININIMPEVKASFAFDDPGGCSPLVEPLKNGSTSTATWVRFWDDEKTPSAGYPVNALPVSYTFLNNTDTVSKIYRPKLKVAYIYNGSPVCPDSITRQLEVYPKVSAYFAAKDSFKICHPGSVSLSNKSRIGNTILSPTNTKLTYKWLFGDNGSSSDFEPSHLYYNYSNSSALVDTVTLTAISKYGCSSVIKKNVTIYPKPKTVFDVENSIACPPFKVTINHGSEAELGTDFKWQFHDGRSDTTTRKATEILYHYFYNGTGSTLTYPIELTATTPHNCIATTSQDINVYPPVKANFDRDSAGCNPFIMPFKDKSQQADTWYWDFGDKLSSKTESPQHTFFNYSLNDTTYTVKLHAASKFLCSHDTFRRITVYPQPIAEFEADRYYFTYSPTNNIVNFTNKTNAGNWNYSWNFDDRTPIVSSNGPVIPHDYQPHWDGRYNVLLKVWSKNCMDSITHRVTIEAPKPIADFSMSENGCVPWTISFTELTDYGTKWTWEFGDGGTYDGQNPPPYTYYKAGSYKVKLTVTGNGGTSYAFKDVEVYPKPKVDFDVKPKLVSIDKVKDADGSEVWGGKVYFYNKCDIGTRFLWNFGDSVKSDQLEPSHIYKAVGKYTVKLGAWTVHQCYDELTKKDIVEVTAKGICEFPNAFTPDTDGPNDGTYVNNYDTENTVFHPSWVEVVEYKLEIYDRWGEKLFETKDINKGWNGYYKGKLCKTDVYVWKATGKYADGATFEKAGNVTLLR